MYHQPILISSLRRVGGDSQTPAALFPTKGRQTIKRKTATDPRPSLDNYENRNNWFVALSGIEPESSVGQSAACTNWETSGQGMGRTVRNNCECSLSGPHTVLCQSIELTATHKTEVLCSSRETPLCGHLQGTWGVCADVTAIHVCVSKTEWRISSEMMMIDTEVRASWLISRDNKSCTNWHKAQQTVCSEDYSKLYCSFL